MDRNLEVRVFEVYQGRLVPLPDKPQNRCHHLHLELRQRDDRSLTGPQPPCHLLHKKQTAVEAWDRLIHRLQSPLLEYLGDLLLKY